jgi:hypothetical protein
MARQETIVTPPSRIQWLSDLIRLEIALWDRINTRLKKEHDLPLAFFESLYFIGLDLAWKNDPASYHRNESRG